MKALSFSTVLSVLCFIAAPAFAQRDTMRVSERLSASVIPKPVDQKNTDEKESKDKTAPLKIQVEKKEKSK